MPRTPRAYGYHGTSAAQALAILADGFFASDLEWDWLGKGAYFWQDAPRRALEWAQRDRRHADGAVVGVELDLADCLDLLDIGWEGALRAAYEALAALHAATRNPMPTNRGPSHGLDRAVVNYLVESLSYEGVAIRSVRAAFREGAELFPGAAMHTRSHVQITARDQGIILERWREV